MKRILLFILTILTLNTAWGQVTVSPLFPSSDEQITITYDATQGASGLEGATGVMMHAGVILEENGLEWEHVVGEWGNPNSSGKMTSLGDEKWQIIITPRTYFAAAGLPADATVYRLSMVFREEGPCGGFDGASNNCAEGKDPNGSDIFVDLYTSDKLELNLLTPLSQLLFVDLNEQISISAASSKDAVFSLYRNQSLVETTVTPSNEYSYQESVTSEGKNDIAIIATAGEEADTVTFSYITRADVDEAPLPAGVKPGVNYNATDDSKAVLVLEAPGKSSVYAIGDFNDWTPSPAYSMKKDDKFFWLEIDGLVAGKDYVFQFLVDEELRIADPFTEQVSDPWEDKYITEETYSGLVKYPEGKTQFRASVLRTGQDEFEWKHDGFTKPANSDLVIYELLIRDFDKGHSYLSVIDRLDYLDSLGVNAIELMPVNEFEGNLSWGYNPNFCFAADKYYGPREALKMLIDECHKRDMLVLMDMVLNHSYNSSPWAKLYWNAKENRPAANSPWYNEQSNFENTGLQWGSDFNHESASTKGLMDSILVYWLREFHFDGYRLDFTKGFSNNPKTIADDEWGGKYDADRVRNLKRLADVVWAQKADALVILEHLADNDEEKELADYGMMLWGNMHFNYKDVILGKSADLKWGYAKERGWDDLNLVSYMESHDEERQMYEALNYGNSSGDYNVRDTATALDRMKLAASFFFTIPGPKMIWQFGEYGYDISIDYNGRTGVKPLKWEYLDDPQKRKLFDTYRSLIHLKKSQAEAFNNGTFTWDPSGNTKWINLEHESLKMSVVANFGTGKSVVNPQFISTGKWYDYFSGDSLEVTDLEETVTLAPGEFHIFTNKKLATAVEGNPVPFKLSLAKPTELKAAPTSPTGVDLNWMDNSNSEVGYVVERSADEGATFEQIADLQINAQTYTDAAVKFGQFYYRVKAKGSFKDSEYSETITTEEPLALSKEELSKAFIVYPNPVTNITYLLVLDESAKVLYVKLTDLKGENIQTIYLQPGAKELKIDMSDLASGLYLINIHNSKSTISKKVLKQ
ncbi:alpha-amylase family glycosyl hydrolase [Flammeovirgaceae bacterium SG7u.111]|nr:alpha-amylase family glycosyl hydrolase [Flammeovirgaceae bacterium SG7u.132]WPO34860.1 alpha-amylase family glycosyl hydrolase [Flammeovirgaceae bacterium SG7u.111]